MGLSGSFTPFSSANWVTSGESNRRPSKYEWAEQFDGDGDTQRQAFDRLVEADVHRGQDQPEHARHPAGIAPSTSPLPSSYTVLGPVEASSCKWVVLFLPVSGKSTTDEIIGQLVQSKGGTALIGVTVEHQVTQYPFVGSDCSIVKGLAVKGARS